MITTTDAASSTAQVHSNLLTRWWVARAFEGEREQQRGDQQGLHQQHRAQPERRRLQAEPDRRHETADPPRAVLEQSQEQLEMADLLVGDLMRGTLVDDIADGDEQRGAEGQQCGDIRLLQRGPPNRSGH